MENIVVLMVLPKKTVLTPQKAESEWETDKDSTGITLFSSEALLGHAMWQEQDDFGFSRPAVRFVISDKDHEMKIFTTLVSELAVAYDRLPGRYPLYIRLDREQLPLIAAAARMGFLPYFGTWSQRSDSQSARDWEAITQDLRQEFGDRTQA